MSTPTHISEYRQDLLCWRTQETTGDPGELSLGINQVVDGSQSPESSIQIDELDIPVIKGVDNTRPVLLL